MKPSITLKKCKRCGERKYFAVGRVKCGDCEAIVSVDVPLGQVRANRRNSKAGKRGRKDPSKVFRGQSSPKFGRIVRPDKGRANPNDRYNFHREGYQPDANHPARSLHRRLQ